MNLRQVPLWQRKYHQNILQRLRLDNIVPRLNVLTDIDPADAKLSGEWSAYRLFVNRDLDRVQLCPNSIQIALRRIQVQLRHQSVSHQLVCTLQGDFGQA